MKQSLSPFSPFLTAFNQISHLATDHRAFVRPTKFPLVDQPLFPLQLQVREEYNSPKIPFAFSLQFKTGNWNIRRSPCRLLLHVGLQLAVVCHHGPLPRLLSPDGPHGDVNPLCLVPDQQGYNRQLLVRNTIQGHVPPMGALWIEIHHEGYLT